MSLQLRPAVATHWPLVQALAEEQGFPSSQDVLFALFVYLQPVELSQLSVVHGLLSLHVMAVPAQLPPLHVSLVVQAFPSLQLAVLFM